MHEKLVNRLTDFIQFEKEIRAATDINTLGFTVCNYLRKLLKYEVAVLLVNKAGSNRVHSISGVSDFDKSSPLVVASEKLCNHKDVQLTEVDVLPIRELPEKVRDRFDEIYLYELAAVNLTRPNGGQNGVLLMMRSTPWLQHESQLLMQVRDVVSHALCYLTSGKKKSVLRQVFPTLKPDWRWAICALMVLSVIPVPQSVIADAKVTAKSPTVVAAGLNGVVEELLVRPNEKVRAGQLLVRFDDTDLVHRKNTLQQELALARERLRKAQQQTLNTTSAQSQSAELEAQIRLKELEMAYVDESITGLELYAVNDGIALYSEPQDWVGRAVSTGEKIMEIAASSDNQFEILVAANDAIELEQGRQVKFFPLAKPLQAVKGSVDSVGFFAEPHDGELLTYRILAEPESNNTILRLGMKGTARLYGEKVSLGYHLLRKPISAVRRTIGV